MIVKILDERALEKLEELEDKKMIKLGQLKKEPLKDWSRFVGSLDKSKLADLDRELQQLREEWE